MSVLNIDMIVVAVGLWQRWQIWFIGCSIMFVTSCLYFVPEWVRRYYAN